MVPKLNCLAIAASCRNSWQDRYYRQDKNGNGETCQSQNSDRIPHSPLTPIRPDVKLLNKYLLVQFIKHFFTINIAFAAIYLLVDFIEKFDNFSQAGKSFWLAMKFFLLNIPFIVDQLGPIMILLSGVITLGILNHTNELNALKAGGIPLQKIVRPLFIGGLLLTGLFTAAGQWLLPYTIPTAGAIWDEEVNGKLPLGIYRNGRYYYKGIEGFYSFERPDLKKFEFKNFSYSQWDTNYNTRSLLSARQARWNEEAKQWVFDNVQTQVWQDDGTYRIENVPQLKTQLPEKPIDFVLPRRESAEQSLTGLYQAIGSSESDWQANKAWADFLSRLSYLLFGLPLLVLGLPVLLYCYQKWGRDLYIAIPASCGLAFLAWGIWGALQSLAGAGYLPPLLAATAIHLVFAGTGIMLLRNEDR